MARASSIALLATALALTACSTTEDDWKKATSAKPEDEVTLYAWYVARNPASQYAPEARRRLQIATDREEDLAWDKAKAKNSAVAINDFLMFWPWSRHLEEAKKLLPAAEKADKAFKQGELEKNYAQFCCSEKDARSCWSDEWLRIGARCQCVYKHTTQVLFAGWACRSPQKQ